MKKAPGLAPQALLKQKLKTPAHEAVEAKKASSF
jgi:hypothetical protein